MTPAAKKAFVTRMAAGRKKAARNPKNGGTIKQVLQDAGYTGHKETSSGHKYWHPGTFNGVKVDSSGNWKHTANIPGDPQQETGTGKGPDSLKHHLHKVNPESRARKKRRNASPAPRIVSRGKGKIASFQVLIGPRVIAQYATRAKAAAHLKAIRKARNPEDMEAASAMYEQFHGRASERIIDHSETLDYRSELAQLGKLIELRIAINGDRATLDGFGNCHVACDPQGKNIAFLGGSQGIDLAALEIDSEKDLIELGECTYIKYFSRKGFHDFAPIDYFHSFGEENGIRPVLGYDTFNKKLFLIGGDYTVKPEGIVN
jgi:hypothetical protein